MRISKSVINGGLVLYCLPGQILASPLGIPSSGSDVDSSSSFSISKRAALQSKTWVNGRTREEQCANSGKIPDWETAVKVYEENHIPWLIQGLIDLTNNGDEDGWLRKSEEVLFGHGVSDAFGNFGSVGCSLTTGTSECNPGNLEQGCYQFDEKIEDGAMAYWAYNAVKGAHDKIAMMREKNFFSSFSQSLSLGRFVQDFDASELRLKNSLFDILSWVGYAMILIANFMPFLAPGAIPLALAAATGSSIGLATLAGSGQAKANNPEPDSQEEKFLRILDLEAMLQEFFDGTRQHLEKVARLAVGVKYEGDEYSDLPSSEDVDKEWRSESLSSSVAHFYSNPIWLIDNNAEHFDDALELAGEVFRLKLIDRTLQLSGWVVGVDETAANKETCEQRGASRWMEIEGKGEFCVSLLWMEPGGEAGPKLAEKGGMTENALKTHKMIDLEVYYNEAIRCSRAGRSGTTELDVADIDRSSKEIPLCYFSMPVYTTWIGLCTVVPPVGPAVQNGRRCREAREMDWDEKPADVQVQYCKDPKWKNGCEIYTVAVNKCHAVYDDYIDQISAIQNKWKDDFTCVWYIGPGCVNNPYDNQKDAKLSDGSGDHNDSIGSFRCWYKGRAPRD